jgi:hypothetical protein
VCLPHGRRGSSSGTEGLSQIIPFSRRAETDGAVISPKGRDASGPQHQNRRETGQNPPAENSLVLGGLRPLREADDQSIWNDGPPDGHLRPRPALSWTFIAMLVVSAMF